LRRDRAPKAKEKRYAEWNLAAEHLTRFMPGSPVESGRAPEYARQRRRVAAAARG
jgi:hypothetical protein